jgi:hypothetical protein
MSATLYSQISSHTAAPRKEKGFVEQIEATCGPGGREPPRLFNDGSGSDCRPLPFLHQFDDIVQGGDLPRFLSKHKGNLTFPEIVSAKRSCCLLLELQKALFQKLLLFA